MTFTRGFLVPVAIPNKGVYTAQARAMARYMVSAGAAEAKVGIAVKKIGRVLGVEVDQIMDKRTVARAVKELGVAADIQVAYEMTQTDSEHLYHCLQTTE